MAHQVQSRKIKGDASWRALVREFPEQTQLAETQYAIPPALLEMIRAETPRILNEREWEFEYAIGSSGCTGFFMGKAFFYPLLHPLQTEVQLDERTKRIDAQLERIQADLVRSSGGGNRELIDLKRMQKRLEREIAIRQRGFIGWLATDAGFHLTRQSFCNRWATNYEKKWPYEPMPLELSATAKSRVTKTDLPFHLEYLRFCQLWNIRELRTWDLPLPIDPGIVHPTVHSQAALGDAGCQFFVPWYLARDEKLTLRDLMAPKALTVGLAHLTPWLERTPKNFGFDRYGDMLTLYVYYELALKRRYGLRRIYGKTTALDRAFGRYLKKIGPNSNATTAVQDSVKKIRNVMQRRLAECAEAVECLKKSTRRSLGLGV